MKNFDLKSLGIECGTIVGKVEITKPIECTQHYETAAWYKKGVSEIGTFDLAISQAYHSPHHFHLYTGLPGKCTGSDFTSLFCGNRIGKGKVDEEVGEPMEIPHSIGLMNAFDNQSVSINEPYIEQIVRYCIDWMISEIAYCSEWLAKHVPNLHQPVDWWSGKPEGQYRDFQARGVPSMGRDLVAYGKVLERITHPCPTDRHADIDAVVAAWKIEFPKRIDQWDRNRKFREKQCTSQ